MNVASYGGGTNSTAMLIGCLENGLKVDLILFAGLDQPIEELGQIVGGEQLLDRGNGALRSGDDVVPAASSGVLLGEVADH